MLKITKATEPIIITTIIACIYGPPFGGKTSLASSADSPFLLDFDMGAHRSSFRKDVVRITTWDDAAGLTAQDLVGYKTLIIDTIGECLKKLSLDIIKGNPKMGTRDGALTLQGYGALKGRFMQWLNQLRSYGLDIVFIAHSDEKDGEVSKERIIAPGSSKNEIYQVADLMGRLNLENGKRTLNFNPTDIGYGKNPTQIPVQEVPDLTTSPDYLGTIIAQTKAGLTGMDAKNSEARSLVEEWRVVFEKCQTAEDFNAWFPKAAETKNKTISAMMNAAAKAKGLKFNRETKSFEAI